MIPYDCPSVRYRDSLPQLDGDVLLTDGGMETTLVFSDGLDLPCFASFPLLEHDEGRAAMTRYFEPYLDVARRHGTGFVLEANTWRANPSGAPSSATPSTISRRRTGAASRFVEEIRDREEEPGRPFVISAPIGPEGDAYDPASRMTAEEAEAYHSWQVGVLAETASRLRHRRSRSPTSRRRSASSRAASGAEMPVVMSFTVETDGRLPSGQPLAEAIEQVDARRTVPPPTSWSTAPTRPISCRCSTGLDRGSASSASARTRPTKSHAELDESEVLDDGDPVELAGGYLAIGERLPHLTVLGGCCGTDHRHVASVADAWFG